MQRKATYNKIEFNVLWQKQKKFWTLNYFIRNKLTYLRMLFTQSLGSQIWIAIKFNIMSKIRSKHKNIYEMN